MTSTKSDSNPDSEPKKRGRKKAEAVMTAAPPPVKKEEKEPAVPRTTYIFSKYELAEDDPRRFRTLKIEECVIPDFDSRLAPRPLTEEFLNDLSAGQRDPIHVCMLEDGRYLVIDGRGRFNGLKQLGRKTVQALLLPPPKDGDEDDALEVFAVNANRNRENLTAFDFAMKIEALIDKGNKNAEIARKFRVSEAFISQVHAIFKLPADIIVAFKAGEFGDSAINKLRAITKVKDANVQHVLARTARTTHLAALQRIINGYDAGTDGTLKIDPRVIELVLRGDLEPNTTERLKTLAKLRNYEQQFETAKILARETYKSLREGKDPPSIDELNEWVSAIKRQAAGITEEETDRDEGAKFVFKPLTPTRVTEAFETWSTKYKDAKKDEEIDPIKLAELRGVIKGIKLAGGYEKA